MSGAAITGYRKADSQVFVTFPTSSFEGKRLTEERFRKIEKETLQPTKGKKAHSFLKDGRLRKVTPQWRLESTIGKVVAFFEKILHVIAKLWPFRPAEIDQRLFASLCSSSALIEKAGTCVQLSSILDYTLRFMKQESKRSKVPKTFLRELRVAKDLAKEMEGLQRLTNEEVRAKKLSAFVAKVTKQIEVLKPGSSLTIPGGWVVESQIPHAPPEEHGALYRFTRADDGLLSFSLVSRDPEVSCSTLLASAGKMKIYPETKFCGLQDKQLTDPTWLTSLVQLQLPPIEKKGGFGQPNEQVFVSSRQSIAGLLKRFASHQVEAPKGDPAAFVTGKSVGVSHHNVASLVDIVCNPTNRKGEVAQRRRLRFQLTSFCEFFWAVKKTLPENATNRFLLREGMQNISRKTSLLFERGQIAREELVFINKQLASVETHLDQIDFPKQKGNKSPFLDKAKPRRHLFACHYDFLRAVPERTKNSASSMEVRTAAAPFPEKEGVVRKKSLKAIEDRIDARTIATYSKEIQTLMESESYDFAMERIVAIAGALVLPKKLEEITLTPDESEAYSEQLLALSEQLKTCMQERDVALPEHLYSLCKVLSLQYQLARANEQRSRFPKEFRENEDFFPEFSFIFSKYSSFSSLSRASPSAFKDCDAIDAVKKDMGEALRRWSKECNRTDRSGYNYTEHLIRTNFAKLQQHLGLRAGKQIGILAKQIEIITILFPWKSTSSNESTQARRARYRRIHRQIDHWKRPFETVAMRALVGGFSVSKGSANAIERAKKAEDHQGEKLDFWQMRTQEAIVKDPITFLKAEQSGNEPHAHETTKLPGFAKEDLSDLLLLLTKEHSVQEFLGLITQKRYLLESADARALVERALFSGTTLAEQLAGEVRWRGVDEEESPLSVTKNAALKHVLPRILKKEIDRALSLGKVEPALFLLEVMQRMGVYIRGIPDYLEKIPAERKKEASREEEWNKLRSVPWKEVAHAFSCAPFFDTVAHWAQDSLRPDSPHRGHKRLIWRELLLCFLDKEELSTKEICLLLQGVSVLQSSSSTVFTSDMRREHAVRALVEKWRGPLKRRVGQSPALRAHLCDLLCMQNQLPLTKASWVGEFPLFRGGNYEVDLLAGTVTDRIEGTTTAALPPQVIRTPIVQEFFSTEQLREIRGYTYREGGKNVHYCKDSYGNEVRMERVSGEQVAVHKKLTVGQQEIWTQCISRDLFIPPARPKLQLTFKGVFLLLRRLIQGKVRAEFPAWLRNPSYRFSIDPKRQTDIYVSDTEGKPLFKLIMRRHLSGRASNLSSVVDLRENPKRPFAHFTVDSLDSKCHLSWRSLLALEKPENIMVWRRKGQIVKVELPRYGFSFVRKVRDGKEQIVCTNPHAKGWVFDPRVQSSLAKKGIARGLLLVSPSDSSKRRVLFPDFSSQVQGEQPQTDLSQSRFFELLGKIFTAFFAKIRGLSQRFTHADILTFIRRTFVPSSWKTECFFMDVDPHTWEWYDHSKQSVDHFLYLSLLSVKEGKYRRAMEFLRLAEKEKSGHWTKEQLIVFKTFAKVPQQGPDVVALQLHAALVAKKRLVPSQRFVLDEQIVELYKRYLGQGKKLDRCLRISREDEYVCLSLLKDFDPAFVDSHLSLLLAQGRKGLTVQSASYKKSAFFPIYLRPKKALKDLANPLYQKIKKEAKRIDDLRKSWERGQKRVKKGFTCLLSSREKQKPESRSLRSLLELRKVAVLEHRFLEFYNLIAFGDPKSSLYRQGQALLNSASETRGSFHEQLVNYLEAVVEVRKGGGSLPKAPSITFRFPDYDRREEREKAQEQERKQDARNQKELEVFLEKLDQALAGAPFGSVEEPSSSLPELNQALWDKLNKQMESLVQKKRGEVFTGGDPAVLMQKLCAMKPAPLPLVEPKSHGHALFSEKELGSYFTSVAQETLSSKEKEGLHPNLLREIAAAENNRDTGFQLKGEKERAALEKSLAKAKQSAEKESAVLKEKVLKLVYPKATDAYQLAVQGKREKQVEWENILQAFLQRDLFSLEQELPGKVNMDTLRCALRTYVIVASKEQRLGSALCMTQMMAEDKDGRSPDSGLELYKWLAAERQFDSAAHDHLLVFEFLSGFLLRADQMNLVNELAGGKGCIKQAVTGAGKTSVILILTALMRASGTNLVTLQFPKALYEENLAYVQRKLGKVFQRNLYPLRYSMRTPLAVKKQVAVEGTKQTKVVTVSYFQGLFEDLVRTTVDKGVLVTTRGSLQALEQRWILLLHRLSNLPEGESWSQVEKDHFDYLTKILQLLRERQENIIDEFDSELSPKEESHLTIGDGKSVAPFLWKSALDIFDLLIANDKLGIRKNIQGEQSDEMRAQVLKEAAGRLADKWNEEPAFDRDKVVAYLQGKEEIAKEGWSPEVLDELAASKDLLETFLPLTLSKSGRVKYMRSQDGMRVVPCLYTDVPREEARPGETLEDICYHIQDWYQQGISESILHNWVQKLKHEAENACRAGEAKSLDDTKAAKRFRTVFPAHLLSQIQLDEVGDLCREVNKDPKRIRPFLEQALARIEVFPERVSCNGFNLVSMSKESGGASATLGSRRALHRKISVESAGVAGVEGSMLVDLIKKSRIRKGEKPVLTYDAAKPERFISTITRADSGVESIVDGGSVLRGCSIRNVARDLAKSSGKGVVFFDDQGKKRVMYGDGRSVLEEIAGISPQETAMALGQAHSRGADVRLGAKAKMCVTVSREQTLQEILQSGGRSRRKTQQVRFATSTLSGITSLQELFNGGDDASTEQQKDSHFRAKKQEPVDIVRSEFLKGLFQQALKFIESDDPAQLLAMYRKGEKHQLLVSRPEAHHDGVAAGAYFARHGKLESADQDPAEVLGGLRQEYIEVAEELELSTEALTELPDYTALRGYLPKGVSSAHSVDGGREIEVDADVETQVDVDVEQEEDRIDMTYFLNWLPLQDKAYAEHTLRDVKGSPALAAFDPSLKVTENFVPIGRKGRELPPMFHRFLHDRIQNRVHYLDVQLPKPGEGDLCIKMVDNLDVTYRPDKDIDLVVYFPNTPDGQKKKSERDLALQLDAQKSSRAVYDMRAREFFRVGKGFLDAEESITLDSVYKQLIPQIAQARFFDGQFRRPDYSVEEWAALKEWLGKQESLEIMETYFNEVVLKYRESEKQAYLRSDLDLLFRTLKEERELARACP